MPKTRNTDGMQETSSKAGRKKREQKARSGAQFEASEASGKMPTHTPPGNNRAGRKVMYVGELAELVGLSRRRLDQINETLAEDKKLFVRDETKKCDLAIFVRRWTEYKEGLARGAAEITLEEAKTQHELLKIEKTRYEVGRLQAELVPAGDVVALCQEIAVGIRNNLLHLPTALAPTLAPMDDPEEIRDAMEEAIRDELEQLSTLEHYEPPVVDVVSDNDGEEEARRWEME